MHPLRISAAMQSGVVGRDDCSGAVGPHKSKNRMQTRRRSRVSRAGCTHAQQVDKQITEYRILAWRSPPNGDRRCSSHLSHRSGQMYEDKHYTASPSPQFTVPQRGRKRLSREATLHTELALEWPELVQIGRCKVQWLPRTANKRNLTSFCSKKTIYTTLPPPGGSFDPETISHYMLYLRRGCRARSSSVAPLGSRSCWQASTKHHQLSSLPKAPSTLDVSCHWALSNAIAAAARPHKTCRPPPAPDHPKLPVSW